MAPRAALPWETGVQTRGEVQGTSKAKLLREVAEGARADVRVIAAAGDRAVRSHLTSAGAL